MAIETSRGTLKKHGEDIRRINWLVTLVVLVLFALIVIIFVTIGGFLQNYLANRQATYQNLVNQVTEQNTKIDFMLRYLEVRHSTSTY